MELRVLEKRHILIVACGCDRSHSGSVSPAATQQLAHSGGGGDAKCRKYPP